MLRARSYLRLAALAASLAACTAPASRATVPEPEPAPAPAQCTADSLRTVVVTAEVDSATLAEYLATTPLGACQTIEPVRIATGDARDALDRGLPLLVTSVPALLAYVDGRPDLESTPLPWDRAYALLLADSSSALLPRGAELDTLRAELARDVVRGDARPVFDPACGASSAGAGAGSHVAYPAGDAVARSIASRLVAIAPGAEPVRVVARGAGDVTRDGIAVISYRVGDASICERMGIVVPLVETRARAITPVRRP